jgi:hypothetical protein
MCHDETANDCQYEKWPLCLSSCNRKYSRLGMESVTTVTYLFVYIYFMLLVLLLFTILSTKRGHTKLEWKKQLREMEAFVVLHAPLTIHIHLAFVLATDH